MPNYIAQNNFLALDASFTSAIMDGKVGVKKRQGYAEWGLMDGDREDTRGWESDSPRSVVQHTTFSLRAMLRVFFAV